LLFAARLDFAVGVQTGADQVRQTFLKLLAGCRWCVRQSVRLPNHAGASRQLLT